MGRSLPRWVRKNCLDYLILRRVLDQVRLTAAEEAEAARFVPLLHAAKVSSSASAVKTAAILFIITLSPFYAFCAFIADSIRARRI